MPEIIFNIKVQFAADAEGRIGSKKQDLPKYFT